MRILIFLRRVIWLAHTVSCLVSNKTLLAQLEVIDVLKTKQGI